MDAWTAVDTLPWMGQKSREVDLYIEKSAPFAQPILRKLRTLFHKADARIEEKLKWGVPSFEYKGIVGGVAAFKKHVAWGLWKGSLLKAPAGAIQRDASSHMSGGSPRTLAELPDDAVLIDLIQQAVDLNDRGVKLSKRSNPTKKPPLKTPPDLAAALKKNPKARATYEAFSPSHKREYVEWITEAKQDATRARRLAQAVEWLAEGKSRNWKYERKK